jgi:hypothetical protein
MSGIFRFTIPKKGHKRRENEDSVYFRKSRGLFAVADGATEGFDSRRWAALLASQWIRSPGGVNGDIVDFQRFVDDLAKVWSKKWEDTELPWYSEAKFHQGSFSTFLGLYVDEDNSTFTSIAVGDTCLFVFDKDRQRTLSFPLESAEDFNSNPVLIPSIPRPGQYLLNYKKDKFSPGSRFIMMSDAVAAWFLRVSDMDGDQKAQDVFWSALEGRNRPLLDGLIQEERAASRMKNDDVSVVFLNLEGA